MGRKYQEEAVLLWQEQLSKGIWSMTLEAGPIAREARAGQFVSVYSKDSGRMLPRPISICEADAKAGTLRLVYRVAGAGTAEFAGYGSGQRVDLLGPLGNGYPLEAMDEGKRAFLIGGGIGIPPLLELAKRLPGRKQAILGYRDAELFLADQLGRYAELCVATEDGSRGTRGNVLDCIRERRLEADVIYACGPKPMLRAVKQYAEERGIECYLSLEERMACGIGACLACVCASREVDEHSQVKNKRVCAEGPVFRSTEILL